jgi:hypothetical protein
MARARKHDISSICVEMDEMNEGALWLERLALVVHGVFASTQADSRRAAEPITGCSSELTYLSAVHHFHKSALQSNLPRDTDV